MNYVKWKYTIQFVECFLWAISFHSEQIQGFRFLPIGVSRGHGWDTMATWGCQVKVGERTVGPKGSWTHIHPLVAWLCLPCGRCLPDRLDSVPPAIAEGAIHHDGSHTTAQVVAKGIREDQGKNQWHTDIQEAANSRRLSLQKLTQSAISLTPLAQKRVTFQVHTWVNEFFNFQWLEDKHYTHSPSKPFEVSISGMLRIFMGN